MTYHLILQDTEPLVLKILCVLF